MDTRLIAKNATALTVAGVLAKAVSAVVGIFVTRYLGPGPFGEYSAAYAFVTTFIIFNELGMSQLMVQEGSRDQSVLPVFFGNIILFKAASAAIIYILMLIFMFPAGYSSTVQSMIVILGVAVGFNAVNQSVYNYYQTIQKLYLAAGFQFLTTIVIAGMTMLVILSGLGVIAITVTHLLAYILISMLLYWALRGKVNMQIEIPKLPNMIVQGLPFGIHRIFYNLYFQLTILMLSLLSTNIELGIYSAAFKLVLMLIFLPSLMTSAIYPVLFQLGVSDQSKHQDTIEKVFKVLSAVGIPISVILFVLADPIVSWLYTGEFDQSIPILMIVSWFLAIECMSYALGDVLTTTNRQWQRTFIQGSAAAILFILILVLQPRMGIQGAAYGLMIVEAYIFLGYYIIVRKNVYKVRIWRQLPAIIVAAVCMAYTAYTFQDMHPVLSSFLAGVVYLIIIIISDKDFRKMAGYVVNAGRDLLGVRR